MNTKWMNNWINECQWSRPTPARTRNIHLKLMEMSLLISVSMTLTSRSLARQHQNTFFVVRTGHCLHFHSVLVEQDRRLWRYCQTKPTDTFNNYETTEIAINSTSWYRNINTRYSTLAKFMKKILLPTEMVLKTEN